MLDKIRERKVEQVGIYSLLIGILTSESYIDIQWDRIMPNEKFIPEILGHIETQQFDEMIPFLHEHETIQLFTYFPFLGNKQENLPVLW